MAFMRGLSKDTINSLKQTDLFSLLQKDICKGADIEFQKDGDGFEENRDDAVSADDINNPNPGEGDGKRRSPKRHVFPAIRSGYIDFYYGGGRLFHFGLADGKTGEFTTDAKYASVMIADYKDGAVPANGGVSQRELSDMRLISSFTEGYKRIKENCELYSGLEALGVSTVYEQYSWAHSNGIVVLDIEASFADTQKKQHRIDLVLYDTERKLIRFLEAKHFSNRASLRSQTRPPVVEQIDRYRNELQKQEKDILIAYKNYVDAGNLLFGTNLPLPDKIDTEPRLLIFGFDEPQRKATIEPMKSALKSCGVNSYAVGNIGAAKIARLFEI